MLLEQRCDRLVDRREIFRLGSHVPIRHLQDVVTGPGLRLGSGGQRELVTLAGDEVYCQIDFFPVGPLTAEFSERLVRARNPVAPEAAGKFSGRVGAVDERHRERGRRERYRVQHRASGQGWSSHVFPPDYWMFACPFLGLSAFFRGLHLVYRVLTRAARDADGPAFGFKDELQSDGSVHLFRNNRNIKPTVQRAARKNVPQMRNDFVFLAGDLPGPLRPSAGCNRTVAAERVRSLEVASEVCGDYLLVPF